jgi:glycerate kinase
VNIVIAIDSFKGSLTSMDAGSAIADGIRKVDEKIVLPCDRWQMEVRGLLKH